MDLYNLSSYFIQINQLFTKFQYFNYQYTLQKADSSLLTAIHHNSHIMEQEARSQQLNQVNARQEKEQRFSTRYRMNYFQLQKYAGKQRAQQLKQIHMNPIKKPSPLQFLIQYEKRPQQQKTVLFKQQVYNLFKQYQQEGASDVNFDKLFHKISRYQISINFNVRQMKFYKQLINCYKELKSNTLFVTGTHYRHILNMIIDLPLQNIKTIYLYSNYIRNIENLTFMNMPNIQHLDIQSNQITNIRALKKTNWKNLKMISIHCNPFMVAQLDRIKIDSINAFQILTMQAAQLRFIDLTSYSKWQINQTNIRLSSFGISPKIPQQKVAKTLNIQVFDERNQF